jgi:tetratricopeptide (TPR) repeat protein
MFLSIIERADYYALTDDKERALKYYETVLSEVGGKDETMLKKVANIRFELGKYETAKEAYEAVRLSSLSPEEQEYLIMSLLYTEDTALPDMLDKVDMTEEKRVYFQTMNFCLSNIHNCVTKIEAYTGTGKSMTVLKNVLETYSTISPDVQYRNVLLAGALLENKMYSVSGNIAEEIATYRPDYAVALKIGGYSYYRLGQYEKARDFFHRLYQLDPKNTEISHLLGMTHAKLGDPVTSNLYLNSAVLNGYEPKTEVERQLVYNYFLIGDTKNIFKVFRYLLDEPDANPGDYAVAMWLALEENNQSKASHWSNKGLERFGNDATILALAARVALSQGAQDQAKTLLERSLKANRNLPVALLTRAEMLLSEGRDTLAETVLTQIISKDPTGTFGEKALQMKNDLDAKKALSQTASGSTESGSTSTQS